MAKLVPAGDTGVAGDWGTYGSGSARYDRLNGGASPDDSNGVTWADGAATTALEFTLTDPAVSVDTIQPVVMTLRAASDADAANGSSNVAFVLYQGATEVARVTAAVPTTSSPSYNAYSHTLSAPEKALITDGAALTCKLESPSSTPGDPEPTGRVLFLSELEIDYTEGTGSSVRRGALPLMGVG